MALQTYQDVVNYLQKQHRRKHLLLGNGFSIAYDKKIFSYNALSLFIQKTDNKILKKLFRIINTYNFEQIMNQLDVFQRLANDFLEDNNLAGKITNASDALKSSLIDAVSTLHPEQIYEIQKEKSRSCAELLGEYLGGDGHVFTANYDLLLYWVLMANISNLGNVVDGFGRELIEQDEYKPDQEPEYGDLEWGQNKDAQHIHYLHGALHIFDTGVAIEKEIYDGNYILDNIKKRISKKEYPVFVTAGDGNQKLEHILHNQYLDFCYKTLCEITGSLITVGFRFGDQDHHIINAINKAAKQSISNRLRSVYIGVFSIADSKHVESIRPLFKCKVNTFDARTVNIWNRFTDEEDR